MVEYDPFIYINFFFDKTGEFILSQTPIFNWLAQAYVVLFTLAVPICLILLIITLYSASRVMAIRHKEHLKYNAVKVVQAYDESTKDSKLSEKWTKILTHVESANANDWMLAIIEADIILDEILTKMGYQGESIGEKLKRVEKGDFKTLEQAWEAHKVRNAIAHQGSDFVINQREAKRVIGLYRQVFEEFYYI